MVELSSLYLRDFQGGMLRRSDLVKHSCPLLVNEIIRELHLVDRVNSSKRDQDVLLPGIFEQPEERISQMFVLSLQESENSSVFLFNKLH